MTDAREQIEKLVRGELGEAEAAALRREIETDTTLRAIYDECCANEQFVAELGTEPPSDLLEPSDQEPRSSGVAAATAAAPIAGTRIGTYTVLEVIGHGGMGQVYRAQQDSPHRVVALKLIRPGLTSDSLLRRFEHEAEILGLLQHSGIAQIFEAGAANTGAGPQPYFAMELVEGTSLTRYAEAHKLSIRDRLGLFALICDAVHHAHQKGVIHRDLKPGNILVTEQGQPKILDFGVARVTDRDLQTTTVHTDVGQILGTIPYMSPEQVVGDAAALDIRSDIYALGVILHELLTGALPYDLGNKPIHEAARIIREETPTPLSSRNRVLRGDVETIVAKALEKEKERRYASANDLAEDVRRYLADEPIVARPPSVTYQVSKFARRHRVLVGAIATVFFALLVGIAGTGWGLVQATKARAMAEEQTQHAVQQTEIANSVTEFLVSVVGLADPMVTPNVARKYREVLDAMSPQIEERFGGSPLAEAQVQQAVGEAYANLEMNEQAERHLSRARDLLRDELGNEHARTLELTALLAVVRLQQSQFEEAARLANEILDTARQAPADYATSVVVAHTVLAYCELVGGELDGARRACEQAIAIGSRLDGEDRYEMVDAMSLLGMSQRNSGQTEQAAQTLEETLVLAREGRGPTHPATVGAQMYLGQIYADQQDYARAEELLSAALDADRFRYGPEHPNTLSVQYNLGLMYQDAGRLADAERVLREVTEVRRRTLPSDHHDLLVSFGSLASVLSDRQHYEEAEPLYREVLAQAAKSFPEEDNLNLVTRSNLALMLQNSGRAGEALAEFEALLEVYRRIHSEQHRETINLLNNLGSCAHACGELDRAAKTYREALRLAHEHLAPDDRLALIIQNNLGWLLAQPEVVQYDEAESLLGDCLRVRRRILSGFHPDLLVSVSNLAELCLNQERWEQAAPLLDEALSMCRGNPDTPPTQLTAALLKQVRGLVGLSSFESCRSNVVGSSRHPGQRPHHRPDDNRACLPVCREPLRRMGQARRSRALASETGRLAGDHAAGGVGNNPAA